MHITPEIVVGFHGCDLEVFKQVIEQGHQLSASSNDYDWLGHGIYFWEGSYDRALKWAENHPKVKTPAVIGAFIKLGNCIDLLDEKHLASLESSYQLLQAEFKSLDKLLPENKTRVNDISYVRELDCQVILRLQQANNERIAESLGLESITGNNKRKIQTHPEFYDSVRGMFPEGKELYPGAGFRSENHIQLGSS